MKKSYEYSAQVTDGDGDAYAINGNLECEFNELLTHIQRRTMSDLMDAKGELRCPIQFWRLLITTNNKRPSDADIATNEALQRRVGKLPH